MSNLCTMSNFGYMPSDTASQKNIQCVCNEKARDNSRVKTDIGGFANNEEVRKFHRSFPEYSLTPLRNLKELSKRLGVENIWVKDESYRFGLNAFKVLGGSYAIGKYLANELGVEISEFSSEKLRSEKMRGKLGDLTFVTATDGNHGRGVAWAANRLGQNSVVFMPKGSAMARLENIRKEGSIASITDLNYDDTVRFAKEYAVNHNGVIIQDSARAGYEEIPTWIMLGYTTIAYEIWEQLSVAKEKPPTHIFLQAGVGAFPAAITAYLMETLGESRPIIVIVEPDAANCFYISMRNRGKVPHSVTGFMPTIMAGLACGEPCKLSWDILKDYGDYFVSCSDIITVEGMKTLAYPMEGDQRIVSGESGAVGIGLIKALMTDREFETIRGQLKLNEGSRIVLISTEGDTDPERYNAIVRVD